MNLKKIAQESVPIKDMPTPEILSTYIESIQTVAKEKGDVLPENLRHLIDRLPTPKNVRNEASFEECKILFETVAYLWRYLTGAEIVDQLKMHVKPETLQGSYWMVTNGLLFHGPNHCTIAKQNMDLLATMLKINPFVLHDYMSGDPNDLIACLIKNGGIRMFVSKNRKAFFQMSESTYAKWGKAKVKTYDFRPRIVKIIDFKVPFKGWESGVEFKV